MIEMGNWSTFIKLEKIIGKENGKKYKKVIKINLLRDNQEVNQLLKTKIKKMKK